MVSFHIHGFRNDPQNTPAALNRPEAQLNLRLNLQAFPLRREKVSYSGQGKEELPLWIPFMMQTFLLVDDNAELLALLCEQLRGAGYGHIRTAQSCAAARACFAAEQPELMILDINLPDGDGFSLFRALRAKADVPALFLSARDADADRLFGLGLGADDYLTKPFLMQELLLRVQHLLQRAYRAELSRTKPAPLQLGERCVDLNDAIVTLPEGKTLALTATELALLRKLAENRGHIVTYDALCAAVWGADYYGYENSLGVHIRHLREKLEAEPGAPQFLRTVRGIGYKLTKGEEA